MNLRPTKVSVAALGLALAASGAGAAAAAGVAHRDDPADPATWYDGGHATVADPHHLDVPLRLYDAAGNVVTSGNTSAPLATYVAADGPLRADDQYATLFVHLPQKDSAPGAWAGVQATGTDRFAGTGAVAVPSSLAGKPTVRTAGGYTLADVAAALPNTETASDSFVGVYELRLRTSSATSGVADDYAATYLRVANGTWTVTDAPVLGGDGPDPEPQPVGTTTTATWPARLTYGTAATVPVAVRAASGDAVPTGTVTLTYGSKTLASAALSASGTASLAIARTALAPGSRALTVTYSGATGTFTGSQATRTFTVAKAKPGTPTFKATKAPTSRASGRATVTVPTSSGLAKATGKAVVTLKKGSSTKRLSVTIASGTGTVTLPKLPAGTWTVSVAYAGSSYYLAATSKSSRLVVRSR